MSNTLESLMQFQRQIDSLNKLSITNPLGEISTLLDLSNDPQAIEVINGLKPIIDSPIITHVQLPATSLLQQADLTFTPNSNIFEVLTLLNELRTDLHSMPPLGVATEGLDTLIDLQTRLDAISEIIDKFPDESLANKGVEIPQDMQPSIVKFQELCQIIIEKSAIEDSTTPIRIKPKLITLKQLGAILRVITKVVLAYSGFTEIELLHAYAKALDILLSAVIILFRELFNKGD